MSHKQNDLLVEDLGFQFSEALLRGDIADAQRVIDALKEAGLPYTALENDLLVAKAHYGDQPQDWDDPFTEFRYA